MKYLVFHICLLLKMPLLFAQTDKALIYEGNKQYDKKAYTEAEKKYRKAQEQPQKGVESYFNLGDALYSQGKFDEATQHFRKAIQMARDKKTKAAAYHNLGNTMLKANKLDESIDAYKNVLRNMPGAANTQYNLSYALKKKKQQQSQQQQNQQQNQENNEQKKQQQENGQDKPQPQPQNEEDLSKQEAERILDGLNNKEQNLRKQMYDKGDEPPSTYEPKPW